ncbi:MAG: hypothetical protein KY461_03680 [Actinobacteria bacterium]|nr:hypothetical protein [Actinomycetota bacterium]
MPVNRAHQRYLELLLHRTGSERYPSHAFLERIEESITDRETAEVYADVLLSAAERQRYPSLRMIDRAQQVVARMAIADTVEELVSGREAQADDGDDEDRS